MILVNPPASKPCEPPAGLAQLSGALDAHGVAHEVLDLGLEGLLHLAARHRAAADTWTRRAVKNLDHNLGLLRDAGGYESTARYARAVNDLDRAVATAAPPGYAVSLGNLAHEKRSPLSSADLLRAAAHPGEDPFFAQFADRLTGAVGRSRRPVVGVSITYLSQALSAFAIIGFLRRAFPRITIAAGGGLVTSWMSRADLAARFSGLVDLFVRGPGEDAVLDLAGIPTDRRIRRAAPSYDRFPAGYLAPGFILPYATSTGCWWGRCRFCPERAEGNAYAAVPVDLARAELRGLVARHDPALIHFTDNALSPAMLHSLAGHPPGAPWYGFARVTPELSDPRFCRDLASSGCRLLKLGVESGDDGVLDRMQKGFDIALSSAALRALRDAGVPTYVYLLFGTPGETAADARRTRAFVAAHADCITFLNLAVFNMPLGGPDAAGLATAPFYEGDLSLYTGFAHSAGWGRREIKNFLDREFKRDPAIAPILRRDPPIFTSNHAPFFAT